MNFGFLKMQLNVFLINQLYTLSRFLNTNKKLETKLLKFIDP